MGVLAVCRVPVVYASDLNGCDRETVVLVRINLAAVSRSDGNTGKNAVHPADRVLSILPCRGGMEPLDGSSGLKKLCAAVLRKSAVHGRVRTIQIGQRIPVLSEFA